MHDALTQLYHSFREKGWWRTLSLIPRNILHRLTDFDRRYGTDTAAEKNADAERPDAHEPYEVTSSYLFHAIVKGLGVTPKAFTFMDLGSGKGRVLLLASHYPFRRIIGVEYDERLSAIARANVRRYRHPRRRVATIETHCADAGAVDLPDGDLLIYMFNPFKQAVMARMLARLEASVRDHPRNVLIVYRNPTQRHLLDEASFLERVDERIYRTKRFGKGPLARVAVYRNRA